MNPECNAVHWELRMLTQERPGPGTYKGEHDEKHSAKTTLKNCYPRGKRKAKTCQERKGLDKKTISVCIIL